jgi:hypothetical protein
VIDYEEARDAYARNLQLAAEHLSAAATAVMAGDAAEAMTHTRHPVVLGVAATLYLTSPIRLPPDEEDRIVETARLLSDTVSLPTKDTPDA